MSSTAEGSVADSNERIAGNAWFPDIPRILPHEKVHISSRAWECDQTLTCALQVFPIQIGSELFRLR